MIKRIRILYLFMGVWMLAAASASAALAVCPAPCCRPGAVEKAHEIKESGDCCGHARSSEAEAAAFFDDDYTPPSQFVSADEGVGCQLKISDKCVAELQKGGEFVTHNLTVQFDAPEEAFAPVCAALVAHPGFGHSGRPVAADPPLGALPPIFLKISSFLC